MKGRLFRWGGGLLLLAACALIAWGAYWAGFTKALQIGQFINRGQELSRAKEFEVLAAKLDSGKNEEVRAHLQTLSGILKEQASVPGSENLSLADVLVPTAGLSLIRDYEAARSAEDKRLTDQKSR
ncbi:hypothetical protein L2Y96_06700 [Luteibacter aegosomaticola]|uniref:hypothetical protein n=1 Tax=Luteibacter aegosomaticola TaxID=2911538 RepID=UPI001FF7EE22|nr:hypothetical protein [Luteibacter aegosomaticola]UPG91457.1 hypothetical protein L2Y96_06700 [Luteibacter aegosomaticola]